MVRNQAYYNEAIALRRTGFSYREILTKIPVAKSTLSLWLRSVGLSNRTKHILTEKKKRAQRRAAQTRHNQRMSLVEGIFEQCSRDVRRLTKRELFFIGVALYWAEGSKEKAARPGSGIRFANSDPRMIRLFLLWLRAVAGVSEESIHVNLYIHITQKEHILRQREFWSRQTNMRLSKFEKVYYKRTRPSTNRSNIGDDYHGVLNVMVRSSSILVRKIAGWTEALSNYNWGMV